jgi:hypothetical protein
MLIALSPESRITAIPPVPAGVEMAHMVESSGMQYNVLCKDNSSNNKRGTPKDPSFITEFQDY